jgi:bromodomain adjacent to zinc finger domain protein 1A
LIASSFTHSESKVVNFERSEAKWCFYSTSEQIDALLNTLNERGLRESDLKQNILQLKSNIIENLPNPIFVKNLTMTDDEIAKALETALKENASNVEASQIITNTIVYKNNKRQLAKIQDAMQQVNNYATITSQEFLELDFKDKLLDIEEQIYNGSLGSLKVDRLRWKAALACGEYSPLCEYLTWGNDAPRAANELTNKNGDVKKYDNDGEKCMLTVNNFAKALLQIEQCIEKRFLRTPLGDSQKTPEKAKKAKKAAATAAAATGSEHHESDQDDVSQNAQSIKYQVLHNWEKSLMNCTTFSQLFIHLQTLDESIAWSKSALNARCRLCKRKGDADKMLLCDKCDCGHHIYCLRPPLQEIPEGDWFCADCKPKDVEKTPRKIRKSFVAEYEEDENEDANGEESSDEDDNDDDEEESESDSYAAAAAAANKKRNARGKKKVSEEEDNSEEENEEGEGEEEEEEEDEAEENEDVEDEEVEDEEDEAMEEDGDQQENGDEEMEEDGDEEGEDEKDKATTKKSQHKIRLNGNHLNRNNNSNNNHT